MDYLEVAHELYKEAALVPQPSLCCVKSDKRFLPNLTIPAEMTQMNYGCGTTVHYGDLNPQDTILYVGVGGGMEALEFSYFTQRKQSVVGVDRVPEMLDKARENFKIAAQQNPWFQPDFVKLVKGDALALPVDDESVDVAAQNCLFNIFKSDDLAKALQEMYRVLKPGGRLYISDPIATKPLPEKLRNDERLRAMCLGGALTYQEYLNQIARANFGTIEIRSRRPYRLLDSKRYDLAENILLESIELVAYKDSVPDDGPCVFAGQTAIYFGENEFFDDGKGHQIQREIPLPVCQKTANNLQRLNRSDLLITEPSYHYHGGGCC